MSTILVILAVTIITTLFTALYVAAEFATVSARRAKISQEASNGNGLARMLEPVLHNSKRLDTYIAACQLGITASSLVLGYYGQSVIAAQLAPLLESLGGLQTAAAFSISTTIVLIAITVVQVVFGELVPKSVALRYPERTALAVVVPMRWSVVLFKPVIALFNGTGNLILRLLGVPPGGHHSHVHSPAEIELLVGESAKGGLLDADERMLLTNAFRVNNLTADQVMVPRIRLTAAPLSTPIRDLLALATSSGYTRIPLYEGSIDKVVGIVHIKDLYRLQLEGQNNASSILRAVPAVPWSKPAVDVWNELRRSRRYVAIVFDEYGGTAGMITLEDLLEEIFGELQDEFDDEEELSLTQPNNETLVLDAETQISQLNEQLQIHLPTDAARTIGGLVLGILGRLPQAGESVSIDNITLQVETIDGPRIAKIRLIRQPELPEEAA